MQKITGLIRLDGEFSNFLSCMKDAYSSSERLPIAVNGLTGGAESAFLVEAVREAVKISKSPILVLVESEGERQRVTDLLCDSGISALGYKKRDLVFHNIKASNFLRSLPLRRYYGPHL